MMKKIGIFYGSTTGQTAAVAAKIAARLGVSESNIYNVADAEPSDVGVYDFLIFGCSTWGDGDMQEDMHDFLDGVAALDLRQKEVALFGCGDDTMSETFCDGVGEMHYMLKRTGVKFVGIFDADGLEFSSTKARVDGRIVGLLIDNINHENLTDDRIRRWCDELMA